jgi:hypothetical protein
VANGLNGSTNNDTFAQAAEGSVIYAYPLPSSAYNAAGWTKSLGGMVFDISSSPSSILL